MNISKSNLLLIIGLLVGVSVFGIGTVLAQPKPIPTQAASPLHPTFTLLDKNGENVLTSGEAVSTMQTCGQCHDTEYIQQHAFHSDIGLSNYQTTKDFNASTGIFGKWDTLTYRYLSQIGDERLDLSTAEWLEVNGARVVGGGPATTSLDGKSLVTASGYEASILNENGKVEAWNWNISGTMEMNCFLCHLETPNNEARTDFIQNGQFGDANTATLIGLGVVEYNGSTWTWNPQAFDENTNELKSDFVQIQDPTNANCAACHGEIHTDTTQPLTAGACDLNNPQTATTGQVVSPQSSTVHGTFTPNASSNAPIVTSH